MICGIINSAIENTVLVLDDLKIPYAISRPVFSSIMIRLKKS